jgi:hypothetical protein
MSPFRTSLALISLTLAPHVWGKDVPITLEQCPEPVKVTLRQYLAYGKMDEVAVDKKEKSGGTPVYEAKFTFPNGKRIEVHISPEGKVLVVENRDAIKPTK